MINSNLSWERFISVLSLCVRDKQSGEFLFGFKTVIVDFIGQDYSKFY